MHRKICDFFFCFVAFNSNHVYSVFWNQPPAIINVDDGFTEFNFFGSSIRKIALNDDVRAN